MLMADLALRKPVIPLSTRSCLRSYGHMHALAASCRYSGDHYPWIGWAVCYHSLSLAKRDVRPIPPAQYIIYIYVCVDFEIA